MWATGVLTGTAEITGNGSPEALIVAAGTVLVAIVGGIASIAIALINSRNRTGSAPPPPAAVVGPDAEEFRRRLDDGDEAREIIDRRQERHERSLDRIGDRLERLEAHNDRTEPGWRTHGP